MHEAARGKREQPHVAELTLSLSPRLSSTQKMLIFTVNPSPTPYARPMTSPPSSPQTRRLSLQGLFSRPAAPISPPADLDLEEDTEAGPAGGAKQLRLKRTVSKGFRDFPLWVEVSPVSSGYSPIHRTLSDQAPFCAA